MHPSSSGIMSCRCCEGSGSAAAAWVLLLLLLQCWAVLAAASACRKDKFMGSSSGSSMDHWVVQHVDPGG